MGAGMPAGRQRGLSVCTQLTASENTMQMLQIPCVDTNSLVLFLSQVFYSCLLGTECDINSPRVLVANVWNPRASDFSCGLMHLRQKNNNKQQQKHIHEQPKTRCSEMLPISFPFLINLMALSLGTEPK